MIVQTYLVIGGILYNIKAHAQQIYTRNCYELLYKEMTYESIYVVKAEKQKGGAPEQPIYYWSQDVERKNIWYIVIRHIYTQREREGGGRERYILVQYD